MSDITPNDIINKEFHRSLRGYDIEQVDEFLQQVSERLFRAVEENQRLRAQADDLRSRLQRYQETEELLKNALMLAERTADETRHRAHQEADIIRREAEQSLERERAELDELRRTRARVIAELRAVLHTHLSMLDSQEGNRKASPSSDQEGR
jgi:cell division initiation protein